MFERLVHFSVHNKIIVGLAVALSVLAGGFSLQYLPIDAVPDVTNNQVVILTQSPNLAAQEVEKYLTAPLEMQFLNIQSVIDIRSVSRQGLSVITLVFNDDFDIYLARQLVAEQIKMASENIPAGFGTPQMAPLTTGLGEIYQYTIDKKSGSSHEYDLTELRTIQDWVVKKQLSGIKGVTEISSFGGFLKQYNVEVNSLLLSGFGIGIQDVCDAINGNNSNSGASFIEKNDQTFFIRGEGAAKTISDIEQIVLKTQNGIPILVRDIGKVFIGHAKRFGAMTKNGKGEAVGGIVLMLKGADSEETIKEVKARVAKINKTLPAGLEIKPFIDRTKLIDKSIKTVRNNLIEGGLIVIFVLVLLMGSIRAGLIVASVIPITMLITFGLMNVFGISANLMSLGAIDFGLLVDSSVIVVEAVLFTLHHKSQDKEYSSGEFGNLVTSSSKKVLTSAIFGGIIILIVYLPILSLTGIEGKMFRPMALTVSIALVIAILLSLTYIPAATALLLRKDTAFKLSDRINKKLLGWYLPIFEKAMFHYKKVLSVAVVFFVVTVIVFLRMGGEFIPQLDEGDLAVDFQTPAGTSLTKTIEQTTEAQKVLLKEFKEIDVIVGRIGSSEIPTDPMPPEMADLIINLKDKSEWEGSTADLVTRMENVLSENLPGISAEFTQPIQMRFNEMIAGSKSEFAIKIFGDDLEILNNKAMEVERVLKKINGTNSIKIERISGKPLINVKYNKDALASYGLKIDDLNLILKTSNAGEATGIVFENERRFNIVVKTENDEINEIDKIKNLPVQAPSGAILRFENIAEISYQNAPQQVSREKSNRRIIIGVGIKDIDIESYAEEVATKLDKNVKLSPGYYFEYGGSFENLIAAKDRLVLAVPLALVLIFILLYFSLNSAKQALIVFSAIPFASVGGVFALILRGMPFSISAGIGFIALFGVAVLNGLVLISYFNISEEKNIAIRIREGLKVRFRPVMVTAFVASLGFLPMAISTSAGAEVQKPLATVVIGGLISATLLTLIVLPILYFVFNKKES